MTLASVRQELQFTSVVSIGELFRGAQDEDDSSKERTRIEDLLRQLTVLDFDVESSRVYGRVAAVLDRTRSPIGHADTQIAAVAFQHNLTVVTGNIRHFARVPGLRVENWL